LQDTGEGFKIAFTRSYIGNSWSMLYEVAVRARFEEYKQKGIVSEYTYVGSSGDVTEQLNQLNQLLQEDYDLIMIEAASATSLASVIDEAKAKGIKIILGVNSVPYEGIPCFSSDYTIYSKIGGNYICEKIGGIGNIVKMHGTAGDPNYDFFDHAAREAFSKYNVKILTEAFGNWSDADAQIEMSTLISTYGEQINAVWLQGGMSYGVINAFLNAGKNPVPLTGDDSNTFIQYWYANQDTLDTCMVPNSPAGLGRAMVDCSVYSAAGYEPKELYSNPLGESVQNWVPLTFPWVVFEKDEMNPSWLSQFPDTKVMSLEDAHKSMEGKDLSEYLELYYEDEYVASLFGLDKSLWW
jgi:ribose transport system substrate-binding protein